MEGSDCLREHFCYDHCLACLSRHKELMKKATVDFCQSPLLPRALEAVSDPVMRTWIALGAARDQAPGNTITPEWLESRAPLATCVSDDDDGSHMDAQARMVCITLSSPLLRITRRHYSFRHMHLRKN